MFKKTAVTPFLIIALAVFLCLPYILEPRLDFDADEAVGGLMALHATQGRIPVYYYGQGYMGSPEALLAAGFFSSSDLLLQP